MLVSRKLRPEVEIYPGVYHMFFDKDGKELQKVPCYLAKLRTDDFLDKHLKQARKAAVVTGGK
jgi:hypothetical protein